MSRTYYTPPDRTPWRTHDMSVRPDPDSLRAEGLRRDAHFIGLARGGNTPRQAAKKLNIPVETATGAYRRLGLPTTREDGR